MKSTEFSEIISETKAVVLSAVRKHLAERFSHSLDDVVQEVYLRAYSSLVKGKFRNDSSFSTYIYAIARNESLRMNEKLIREERKMEKLKNERSEKTGDSESFFWDIKKYMEKIPKLYSDVLSLFLKGKSEKEIAAELGVPKGTVKSRANRGREMLKREMEKETAEKLK